MKSLLWTVIALREFEMKMVWLKVNHPVVMDCGRKSQFRNLRFIGQSNLHLQILWEIAVPMQELGAGRCLDGSQTSLDLFVEGFTWMINIWINDSDKYKHVVLNRKHAIVFSKFARSENFS